MKNQSALVHFVLAILLGLIGCAAVVMQIDIGGDYPNAAVGPGMTLDEPFNIAQGVYLNRAVGQFGISLFAPGNASAVFESDAYMSDYPPLGRLWLGAWHDITLSVFPVEHQDNRVVMSAARVGSAVAMGLLLSLLTFVGCCWYGRLAGISTGLFLLFMPRVFGHAHIGSVETIMNLTWTLVVLAVLHWWVTKKSIPNWVAVFCGVLFGIAMLTKIQGVLLSVPIALWALGHWRHRAIIPLALFAFAAGLTFLILWPWLWFDPIPRSLEYLGRTTERVTLHTWYMGTRFKDVDVPWHYPFVMFAVTMPVGILAAGCIGAFKGLKNPKEQLLLACAVFPMALFAVPGITVYDGIRLFLVACPMWALLSGCGVKWIAEQLQGRFKNATAATVICVFVAIQSYGVVAYSPLHLNYYNILVGGLAGADQAGFEPTYWNDCLTREFLAKIPDGATVYLAPVLHPVLPDSLLDQNLLLSERNIRITAFDYELDNEDGYLLLVNRRADLPSRWQRDRPDLETLAEMTQHGVVLARLLKTPQPETSREQQP